MDISHEEIMGYQAIEAAVSVIVAWQKFKSGHDVQALTLRCCDVSAELFDSLEHFEALVKGTRS